MAKAVHELPTTHGWIKNPAHHALREFDKPPEICMPQNGRGGMIRLLTRPVGLRIVAAVAPVGIDAYLICLLRQPSLPPRTHEYDPTRHTLIEGVSKCMISRQEAQVKFNEYWDTHESHDVSATWCCCLLLYNVVLASDREGSIFHLLHHESPVTIEH